MSDDNDNRTTDHRCLSASRTACPDLIENVEGFADLPQNVILIDANGDTWVNLPGRCRDLRRVVTSMITAHRFLTPDTFPFTVIHRPAV